MPPENSVSFNPFHLAVCWLTGFLEIAGELFVNLWCTFRYVWSANTDGSKILEQTARIGVDSLGMSLLICVTAGSVLALQTAEKFSQTGADAYIGGLVALAIVREIAPIFTCLAVGARAGTAIAAELANMKVSEQIDALSVMHIDPIRYLMLPRVIACVLALPMLTLLGEVISILAGMVVAQSVANLHYHKYLESVWLTLKPYDIRVSLFKAFVFGILLASISCTLGLRTKGGAREVGLSTTRAVVWIAISMMVADFFLTWIFFGNR
jgi:phospholipid/cholesterol/gamma-HCH transport system permease protein